MENHTYFGRKRHAATLQQSNEMSDSAALTPCRRCLDAAGEGLQCLAYSCAHCTSTFHCIQVAQFTSHGSHILLHTCVHFITFFQSLLQNMKHSSSSFVHASVEYSIDQFHPFSTVAILSTWRHDISNTRFCCYHLQKRIHVNNICYRVVIYAGKSYSV